MHYQFQDINFEILRLQRYIWTQMRQTKDILKALSRLFIKYGILTASVALSTNAFAVKDETVYTDSVQNWGAWALDIEPAAGGLQAAGTQPLNARSSKLSLRTNSIAALSPRRVPGNIVTPQPMPTPGPGPAPVTPAPAIPTITPVSPSIPIPIGGPAIPGGAP